MKIYLLMQLYAMGCYKLCNAFSRKWNYFSPINFAWKY